MKIITNGCSFTYGDELEDPEVQAWPGQLQELINKGSPYPIIGEWEVINLAERGSSNAKILRDTVEYINRDPLEIDFLIVGWTDCTRTEFYTQRPLTNQRYTNYIGPIQVNSQWATPEFFGTDKFFEEYYKYWQDKSLDYANWLLQMQLLESYCEDYGIDYKFFSAFGNEYDGEIARKYNVNVDNIIGWPNDRMVEWVEGSPKCPNGHPGPEAHKLVAKKILKELL